VKLAEKRNFSKVAGGPKPKVCVTRSGSQAADPGEASGFTNADKSSGAILKYPQRAGIALKK
jgi:hypothetical protein